MARKEIIFRVFVSSTFDDLKEERNALQEITFRSLRRYCAERGARFQAIDLRWGISEEESLDQQTMTICQQELRRCQNVSPRPNFIILLGNRYGWRPLPVRIEASEFETLTEVLEQGERSRLAQWYRRDDNAVPPEYVLQHRAGAFEDHQTWKQQESALWAIMSRAAEQVLHSGAKLDKYLDSATHQEIRWGAMEAENPRSHVFCYLREIEGLPEDATAGIYRDLSGGEPDRSATARLEDLKDTIHSSLSDNVHTYPAGWDGSKPRWDLTRLCNDVEEDLKGIIRQELATFTRRPATEREVEAHREFALDRSAHFRGRREQLDRIQAYLRSGVRTPLVLHGVPGSGKSALMAKALLEHEARQGGVARILGRFIGVTPGSCDLRTLLTGICRELDLPDVPRDTGGVVRAFKSRLSASVGSRAMTGTGGDPGPITPVALFLDALEQLNPTESAHLLNWLPRTLAPEVKLVLSVSDTEATSTSGRSHYGASPREVVERRWGEALVDVGPWQGEAPEQALDLWLVEAGRRLQPGQRREVLSKFAACPYPLFLKLVFEDVRRWRSWEGVAPGRGLTETIDGMLANLLRRLEGARKHGRVLTERALGYLAAARNGLTEDELIDLLSSDRTVIEDLRRRYPRSPQADRLPVVIWSRLHADVGRYMTRRRADGTVVLDFYHRQVQAMVRRRYLSGDGDRLRSHEHLAGYFHGQDFYMKRQVAFSPDGVQVNVRKVVELPYHRLEAAKLAAGDDPASPYWDAVAALLTDWEFLRAKAEATPS